MSTGIYEGLDLANKTFYGFKLINETGDCNVDIINDGTLVELPQNGYIVGPNEYQTYFWSTGTYRFQWGAKGHLTMVCV